MSRIKTKYNHLENNKCNRETDWTKGLLTNGLPKRAFTNPTTAMFILMLEEFMIPVYQQIDLVKNWWRV